MPDWRLPDAAQPAVATRDEVATAAQVGLLIWWLHGRQPVNAVAHRNLLEVALTPLLDELLGRAVVGRIDLHDDGMSMDVDGEHQALGHRSRTTTAGGPEASPRPDVCR